MGTSFDSFFDNLLSTIGLRMDKDLSIAELREIISKINEYLYTYYDGIGTTEALGSTFNYFSEFHKFWEKYHGDILNPTIDSKRCSKIADILNSISVKYGQGVFNELYNTYSLKPREICAIRYFTANQDFRGSRDFEELFQKHEDDPTIFDKDRINEDPIGFLKNIDITSLSQSDKRIKFATVASQILIEKRIEAYDLFRHFKNDVLAVREFLLSKRGSGFGNKKTDMFIRDMVVLGVWKNPKNFDKIDVASDINTVKVAMRTGILKTEIPLVSSLLDIFCYQYGLIDEMNALAWRRVWERWKVKYPKTCIESPCLMDYFVYRIIGKEFCKESLCLFECETGKHHFKWHSARNRTCQVCKKHTASVVNKVLPCTDKDGYIFIEKNEFVSGEKAIIKGIKECPFSIICESKSDKFIKLNPPKSISILGQTGWESARIMKDEGGGGLMS